MKKILLTVMVAAFMLSAFAVPSYSQTVGVAVGDWFVYEGSFTTDPSTGSVATQLSYYTAWAGYESLNRTVTDINGTVITFEDVYTLTAGGNTTQTTVLNISAPTTNQYWAIYSDSDVGSLVNTNDAWLAVGGNGTVVVTDTFTWGFPTPRECLVHESTTSAAAIIDRAFWRDQDTGVLVQLWLKSSNTDGSFTEWKMTLTDTNLWTIPEFPTGTVMLLMFVAVAASMEIYRRKKLNLVS